MNNQTKKFIENYRGSCRLTFDGTYKYNIVDCQEHIKKEILQSVLEFLEKEVYNDRSSYSEEQLIKMIKECKRKLHDC